MTIELLEITSECLYFSRRQFLKGVSALAAGSLLLAACAPFAIRSPSKVMPAVIGTPPAGGGPLTPEAGKTLLHQNGAPIRLAVSLKYGFKSIEAIMKIYLVEEQPVSFWMAAAPDEYGFYLNVNPDVPHPRWSQAMDRRIGELGRRKLLPFNGYAAEVAQLHTGMDLKANF